MYCKHCGKVIADDSTFCQYCGTCQKNDTSNNTTKDNQNENVESFNKASCEPSIDKTKDEDKPSSVIEANKETVDKKELPLLRRAFGSMIDKVLILLVFIVGNLVYHPYSSSGDIGFLMGIMDSTPSNYEFIDKNLINNYGRDYKGIDSDYLKKAYEEQGSPYMGYTNDFEVRMALLFILINIIYYILSESLLRSSLGKLVLGGKLINESNNKITLWKCLLRGLLLGVFAAVVFFVLRYYCEFNYYIIAFIFFLFMDVSLFFCRRSLLDLCTRTKYIDLLKKEDFEGKYGKPQIKA